MIRIDVDQQNNTEDFLTIRDGKRGVVRFDRDNARMLADLLEAYQSPK